MTRQFRKCNPSALSKNAVATISHISILFPSFCLKASSLSYNPVASSIPLVKLLYFHFILNYQRYSDFPILLSLSTLLREIIILSLWADSLYYSFNLLSLQMASSPYYIQKTFALFCSFKLPGRLFFFFPCRMHLVLPFHFIILIHCIFLYGSQLYFDSKLVSFVDETDAGHDMKWKASQTGIRKQHSSNFQ